MNERSTPSRYSRQIRLPAIGIAGQEMLARSRVLVVGLGALGTCAAELLARSGIGNLRLVDRDIVEFSNLQRQLLYTEEDAQQGLPKALCAAHRIAAINSEIAVDAQIADVTFRNIEALAEGVDLIIDGTDNFETRFLINDLSIARGIPWIFGGCLGYEGQTFNILPQETACLNCLMPDGPPHSGELPTCDTAGVLGPMVTIVASFQVTEAIKMLSGNRSALCNQLRVFSMWENRLRALTVERRVGGNSEHSNRQRAGDGCPTCVGRQFVWLSGRQGSETVVLCGRNAVQVTPSHGGPVDFAKIAERLRGTDIQFLESPFFMRIQANELQLTLFGDGRAIITGTDQISLAKSLYARLIGI